MKTRILSSIFGAVLLAGASQVNAQEEAPTIAGVPVATAVAVGIVGATIIAAASDDSNSISTTGTTNAPN